MLIVYKSRFLQYHVISLYRSYYVVSWFWILFLALNRFMTLYISFVRARAVMNLQNALKSQNKTQREILKELCFFVSILTAANFLIHILAYSVSDQNRSSQTEQKVLYL